MFSTSRVQLSSRHINALLDPSTQAANDGTLKDSQDNAIKGLSEDSVLKFRGDGGLYTDYQKPQGLIGRTALRFFALFRSSSVQTDHDAATTALVAHIKAKYGEAVSENVKPLLKSNPTITVRELRSAVTEAVAVVEKNLLLTAVTPSGAKITEIENGSPTDIKKALDNKKDHPAEETEITIIRGGEQTRSEMGYSLGQGPNANDTPDSLIPQGVCIVHGKKTREALRQSIPFAEEQTKKTLENEIKLRKGLLKGNLSETDKVRYQKEKTDYESQLATLQPPGGAQRYLVNQAKTSILAQHTTSQKTIERIELIEEPLRTIKQTTDLKSAKTTLIQLKIDTENYESWPSYKLLAYDMADRGVFDRINLQVNGSSFSMTKDGTTATQRLENFKTAVSKLSNPVAIISDQQAYEMMQLVDKEGATGGFPSGADVNTGIAFEGGTNAGKEKPTMNMTLGENNSCLLSYSSPIGNLASFQIPNDKATQTTLSLITKADAAPVDWYNDLGIPQFATQASYTYSYTPPDSAVSGSDSPITVTALEELSLEKRVGITRSCQAYWQAPVRGEVSEEISRAFSRSLAEHRIDLADRTERFTPGIDGTGKMTPLLNKTITIHTWDDRRTDHAVSRQFYEDISRMDLFLDKEGLPVPLINRENLQQDPEKDAPLIHEGIQKLTDFLEGDTEKALLISQYVNQAAPQELFYELLTKENSPFHLPGGAPGSPAGKVAFSATIAKSSNDEIILHYAIRQPSSQNLVVEKKDHEGNLVFDDRGNPIFDHYDLNRESSFVNMNFSITISKDNSLEVGKIQYEYHLEQADD